MAGGRLTRWFEEQIREVKRGHPRGGHQALGACNPTGTDAAGLMELEGLRDEARRLEGGATATATSPRPAPAAGLGPLSTREAGLREEGENDSGDREPACLAKVREALRRDSKPWMRGALREVLDELGGGE